MTDTACAAYDEHYRPWGQELEAMREIADTLQALRPDQRKRVLAWVRGTFAPEPPPPLSQFWGGSVLQPLGVWTLNGDGSGTSG